MSECNVRRVSLRKEAWKEVKSSFHAWRKWAILAFMATFLGSLLSSPLDSAGGQTAYMFRILRSMDSNQVIGEISVPDEGQDQEILDEVLASPDFERLKPIIEEHPGIMKNPDFMHVVKAHHDASQWSVLVLLLSVASWVLCYYVIPATYIRHVSGLKDIGPSVGNFFFWLWNLVLAVLVVTVPAFVFGMVLYLVKDNVAVLLVLGAALLFGLFYVLVRFQLVSPIAILKCKPVLKKSWDMTKGNVWRVLIGGTMLGFYIALPFLLLFVLQAVLAIFSGNYLLIDVSAALLQACYSVVLMAAATIYSCVAYRVLLQEKGAKE